MKSIAYAWGYIFSTQSLRISKQAIALAQLVIALGLLAAPTFASDSTQPLPAPAQQITLTDLNGKTHSLADGRDETVVLVFVGLECPVANAYAPEVRELQKTFAKSDLRWLGIHSDTGVTAATATKHAADYRIDFPVLLDSEQKLAAAVGAKVLGQVVVLHKNAVIYRGRINDRFATNGKRRDTPTTHELRDVLTALTTGKETKFTDTAAYGCPIPFKK